MFNVSCGWVRIIFFVEKISINYALNYKLLWIFVSIISHSNSSEHRIRVKKHVDWAIDKAHCWMYLHKNNFVSLLLFQ
jgi:hypothetical protein